MRLCLRDIGNTQGWAWYAVRLRNATAKCVCVMRILRIISGYIAAVLCNSMLYSALVLYLFRHHVPIEGLYLVLWPVYTLPWFAPVTLEYSILPAMAALYIAEHRNIRSPLYYVLAGLGAGVVAWGAFVLTYPPLPGPVTVAEWEPKLPALTTAGLIIGPLSGYIYWLVAGRTARTPGLAQRPAG